MKDINLKVRIFRPNRVSPFRVGDRLRICVFLIVHSSFIVFQIVSTALALGQSDSEVNHLLVPISKMLISGFGLL